tara:strand:- start:291 stop:665 length:375 start_codon:yes stop_codon:yes gene_type:complete
MVSKYIVFTTVAALIVLSGCVGSDNQAVDIPSYEACATEDCVADAIYNDCTPTIAELDRVEVTVQGERKYGSATAGAASLCEVNFKYPDREKTCAFAVWERKSLREWESFDEFCATGSNPPSSF